jgi:Guanylate kinase
MAVPNCKIDLTNVPVTSIVAEVLRRLEPGALNQDCKSDTGPSIPQPLPPRVCRPVVISGPSGVGKGTILKRIQEKYPQDFGYSISHTTRKPRAGEESGVDYHFVTKEQFLTEVTKGNFIEYANVHGNYYGTTVQSIHKVRSQHKVRFLVSWWWLVRLFCLSPLSVSLCLSLSPPPLVSYSREYHSIL